LNLFEFDVPVGCNMDLICMAVIGARFLWPRNQNFGPVNLMFQESGSKSISNDNCAKSSSPLYEAPSIIISAPFFQYMSPIYRLLKTLPVASSVPSLLFLCFPPILSFYYYLPLTVVSQCELRNDHILPSLSYCHNI
jgi:hypothetical protein